MNAPDQHGPGPEDPKIDDTFDHFFSKRPQRSRDETQPVPHGAPSGAGADEPTMAWPVNAAPAPPAAPAPSGYSAGGDGPTQAYTPPPPPPRKRSSVLPVLVIVASLIVVGVVAFFALGVGTHDTATSATTPLPTQGQTPQRSPGGSSSSTATASASALPTSVLDCHSATYSVGPKTSCEFGASVAAAAAGADFSGGSATLTGVYSPTTKKTYTLECTDGAYLTCVSTTDAVVYVEKP